MTSEIVIIMNTKSAPTLFMDDADSIKPFERYQKTFRWEGLFRPEKSFDIYKIVSIFCRILVQKF